MIDEEIPQEWYYGREDCDPLTGNPHDPNITAEELKRKRDEELKSKFADVAKKAIIPRE